MMMRREQAARHIGVAPALPHARVALHVCASDVSYVDFQTAAAKLAQISLGILKRSEAFLPFNEASMAERANIDRKGREPQSIPWNYQVF